MLTADQSVTAFKTAFLTGISDDEPRIPARRWFRRPSTGGPRVVPYSSIAANADKEYQDFLTMDPRIECTCNDYEQMKEWLTSTPHEEIVARMETIPSGLSGAPELGFTAAQRMYMLVTLYRPFSVTSRVYVSNQTMRDIASYRPSADSRFRKEPIEAQFSVPAGGLLDTNICELPTAAGKTSICCAIAGVALGPVYWNILKNEYQQKRVGGISQGAPVPYYARLCIINTAAGTFDHFATTLKRLIPTLEAMNPQLTYHLWTTCGAGHTTTTAAALPANNVVFWIVPNHRANEVLKQDKRIVVALQLLDEGIVDVPREKSVFSCKSPVMKRLILQATPHMLVDASRGNNSIFRTIFEGTLMKPCDMHYFIERRDWKEAELCARQVAQLKLITNALLRPFVRNGLRHLVSPSLNVYFVDSYRYSLSGAILNHSSEFVPANLLNTLCSYMRAFYPTAESLQAFRVALTEAEELSPDFIVQELNKMRTTAHHSDAGARVRIIERIHECAKSCPVCMEESSEMRAYPCCGACLCEECFATNNALRPRCPLCRAPFTGMVRRDDAEGAVPAPPIVDSLLTDAPTRPAFQAEDSADLNSTLDKYTKKQHTQMTNMTLSLHILKLFAYRRILIIAAISSSTSVPVEFYNLANEIGTRTGIQITRVDDKLSASGREFTAIKRKFDDMEEEATKALLCYGLDERISVGVNFDVVDAVVVIGDVEENKLTQFTGRYFRPNAARDNTRPVAMVKLQLSRRA